VKVLWKHKVQSLDLAANILMVILENGQGKSIRLPINHAVICVGRRPCVDLLEGVLPAGAAGDVTTALPGLYLAGDMIRGWDRFVATAIGDGQRAARLAGRFLNKAPGISSLE